MNLGVIIRLREETDLDAKIKEAKEMGFDSVQFTCWQMERYTDETAETILNALKKYGVRISTFWCGWRGKESWMWNSYEGPLTLGIVPPHARFERILDLKKRLGFCKEAWRRSNCNTRGIYSRGSQHRALPRDYRGSARGSGILQKERSVLPV